MTTDQPNRPVPPLDAMLTREECAAWLGVEESYLARNEDKIVPFHPTHKVVRYHPRTILAKLAFDSGVPLQIIAASYGKTEYITK